MTVEHDEGCLLDPALVRLWKECHQALAHEWIGMGLADGRRELFRAQVMIDMQARQLGMKETSPSQFTMPGVDRPFHPREEDDSDMDI